MTEYAICFDFPERPGDPMFAGFPNDAPGLMGRLENATRFESEIAAERFLINSYGPETRSYGVVVEVGLPC